MHLLHQTSEHQSQTMPSAIFSIGHSTHEPDRFQALLARHQIGLLADVRRFPGSRKFPHFNAESLSAALSDAGIEYRWFEDLGGRRKVKSASIQNACLRNESFRNYADYMATDAFRAGVERLLEAAAMKPIAIMCSEGVFWRCHRRLIADYLLMRNIAVRHIMPSGDLHEHSLTSEALIVDGQVTYPPPAGDAGPLLFE